MVNKPRDGVLTANGLSADFRFIRVSPNIPDHSYVETAIGDGWFLDRRLTYDPPHEPETARKEQKP